MTGAVTLHASAVALGGRAVLIRGASGSGKSALSLGLMARGASLVADDRTRVARRGARLFAWSPPEILGLIEARGVGLLRAIPAPPSAVALVVDLDETPAERLPPSRHTDVMGVSLSLVSGAGCANLADIVIQILKGSLEPTP